MAIADVLLSSVMKGKEAKMPQIWLKRNLYDGLVKRELNVEKKVDELVEDFLGLLENKEKERGDKSVKR